MNAKKTIKGMHAAQQTMYRANFSLGEQIDALQAEVEALRAALTALVDEHCDYMLINHLGNPEDQHNIKLARAALKGKDR